MPNQDESIAWFTRITSYVISNILYLRNLFDEDCFVAIQYEKVKLRVLSMESTNKNAQMAIKMLTGLHYNLIVK